MERRKTDEFGHVRLGGIGNTLAAEIEARTGFETRAVVLGHIQRGGSPTAFDRMLATRYGIGAIDWCIKANSAAWWRSRETTSAPSRSLMLSPRHAT